MKKILVLAIVAIFSLSAFAQKASTETVVIQTNGVCQKCADRFNENVPYFKGVKTYSYDMKTAKLTINYDAQKTNPDQLRKEISKLGFNADNVKADASARANLPACCRGEKSCGSNEQAEAHKCNHQCQGQSGEHKCQHAEGEAHKCNHQCQGQSGEHKCQHAEGEAHKCNHQCQGQSGEHKCNHQCQGNK